MIPGSFVIYPDPIQPWRSRALSRIIDQQARHHRLIQPDRPRSPEEAVLAAMFLKPYETAADLAEGPFLDVGCNTGYGTAVLRERTGARAVGVDVSARAIEAARERWGAGDPGIEFRVVDGRTLPFDDGAFGAVTSCQVIEHIEDTGPFLAEIARVLRPGGRAFLTTPNAAIRLEPGGRPWNRFHVREFRADELRSLLAPHFASVDVQGLFGSPELEAIERARVDRLRAQGRIRNRVSWLLPMAVEDHLVRGVRLLGRLVGRVRRVRRAGSAEPVGWATAELRYEDRDLDRSLDLLAVCER